VSLHLVMIMMIWTCSRLSDSIRTCSRLGSVASSSPASKPSPTGGLRPALTPAAGDADQAAAGSSPGFKINRSGGNVGGAASGVGLVVGAAFGV
jgi:hypothetical protein